MKKLYLKHRTKVLFTCFAALVIFGGQIFNHVRSADTSARMNELRFEVVAMSGARAILSLDGKVLPDPDRLTWTPEMERLTGWAYEEMVDQNVERLVPEDMLGVHPGDFHNTAKAWPKGKVQAIECDMIRKDGMQVPVRGQIRFREFRGQKVIQADFQDLRDIVRYVGTSHLNPLRKQVEQLEAEVALLRKQQGEK